MSLAALSLLFHPTALVANRADRSNPMLVRRVRQELRSKTFIATYLVMLLVAGGAAVISACVFDQESPVGRTMFIVIASTWSALMCIQAVGTQRAIAADRGAAAWDLIELTGIPPFRLVAGVVQSNLVLGLLGAAGLAPFMVMAYLLRGIDLPTILFALLSLPMVGAQLGALAALGGCLGSTRQARAGITAVVALVMLGMWILLTCLWSYSEHGLSPWLAEVLRGDHDALLILAMNIDAWSIGILQCFVFATALLTHRALDRSTWPRLVWTLTWANGFIWFGVSFWQRSLNWEQTGILANAASTYGVLMALVLGLFAISEDIELTPRQKRTLGEGRLAMRCLRWVFGPGSARGARATLLLVLLSLLPSVLWIPDSPSFYVASYGLALLVVSDQVARGPFRRWCQGAVARRVCTISILAIVGLLPLFAFIPVSISKTTRDVLLDLSPFVGSATRFTESGYYLSNLAILTLGAVAIGLLVFRACARTRGLARVTAGDVESDARG